MIRFDNVTKRFADGTNAVDALSIDMPTGEITVLVGTSGCGKTTSLRMVNRMVDPTAGAITIDDRNVMTLPSHELRRGIGYVIQQVGLFPHRKVIDNVTTVPDAARVGQEAITGAGARAARAGRPRPPRTPTGTRRNYRAASSSASAWPGPSPPIRRCC